MDGELVIRLAPTDWIVILAYMAGMLYIGFYFSRRMKTFDDYYLASKKITTPLLIGTLVSTFYGLDTLFGTSEIGFMEGVDAFFAYGLPYTLMYLVMAFLAPKFREYGAKTFSEIIGEVYGGTSRIISACCSFVYSMNTMELMGMGFIFSLVFRIPFWVGVLVAAVIVVVYTYSGGLWAVAMTDMIQFVAMAVTLGVAVILCWYDIGGFSNIYTGLEAYLGEDPWYYFHPLGGYLTPGLILAYGLTALAVLCEPAFFQRIFASKGPKEARNALLIGTPIWCSYEWACMMLGLMAAAAVGLELIPEPHANQALLMVVAKYIPPGFIGLFLAGALAASMSTADSYFLVASGNLVYDIYRPVFRPNASDADLVRLTRYGVLISAVVSVVVAFLFQRIMGVWVFQASVIVNTVLIPLYAAVFLKGIKKTSLAGTLATAVGFFGTLGYYLVVGGLGYFSEEWETLMIDITIGGRTYTLWQEYGIFLIPPFVLLAYIIGLVLGKEKATPSLGPGRGPAKEEREVTAA